MFPHTITIYHHFVENGADVYSKKEIPGWYWMHTAANTGSGKGAEKTDTYKVVASQLTTSLYRVFKELGCHMQKLLKSGIGMLHTIIHGATLLLLLLKGM